MKLAIIAALLAVAAARPDSDEYIAILRDERVHPSAGSYSFDFEGANGIRRHESGVPLSHLDDQPTGQSGGYGFKFPNGESFELTFVADDNGFVPKSAWLPVAPAFPHPIPQFVLDQIEKARREDEDRFDDSYEK